MRWGLLAAALVTATTLLGCDPGALGLPGLGTERLRIREVPAGEVEELVSAGRAEIVQLRDADESLPGIRGARRLTADAPLPEDVASLDHLLIVVAEDRDLGLHLAARLARGGAERVAVAVGARTELLALAGFETAAKKPAPEAGAALAPTVGEDPKPGPPPRHPSD